MRRTDPLLYDYLGDVLLRGERENLVYRLPEDDSRNPNRCVEAEAAAEGAVIADLKRGWRMSGSLDGFVGAMLPQMKVLREDDLHVVGARLSKRLELRLERDAEVQGDPAAFGLFLDNLGHSYDSLVRDDGATT